MTISTHRALEFSIGSAVAVAGLAVGLIRSSSDGTVLILVCVALGAVLISLGLSADREGRGATGAGHAALDRVLAGLMVLCAVIAAVAGDAAIAVVLLVGGILHAALILSTHYAARPGVDDEHAATTVTRDGPVT
jgi:hypothetical protein